jgi:hypothetical protein
MQAPIDIQVARELDFEAQKVDLIAREVLGSNYLKLEIKNLELKEDFAALHSSLRAQIEVSAAEYKKSITIDGEGVGIRRDDEGLCARAHFIDDDID